MFSAPLIRYVLMAALRDRLVFSLMLIIVLGACLSVFLGSTAVVEANLFSLVFAASGLRLAGAFGLILFVVFHMRRSFDNKDIDFLLSRPISRTGFVLSHAIGFSLLALGLALAVGFAIVVMSGGHAGPGQIFWVVSLAAEYIIMVNAAFFFSMVVTSAAGATLAVTGLYILARLIGELLGNARGAVPSTLTHVLGFSMNTISMIIPRLDLMAQTTWLIYPGHGTDIGYGFVLAQAVAYSGLLCCATLIDLRRRQF